MLPLESRLRPAGGIDQGGKPVFGGMELWNWWISGSIAVTTKRRLRMVRED